MPAALARSERFSSFGPPARNSTASQLCPLSSPTALSMPSLGSHPMGTVGQACFRRLLHRLSESPHGCMRRTALGDGSVLPTSLPIYVAVVPSLRARLDAITRRLLALRAPDVTFVECANANQLSVLSLRERTCLNPASEATEWDKHGAFPGVPPKVERYTQPRRQAFAGLRRFT